MLEVAAESAPPKLSAAGLFYVAFIMIFVGLFLMTINGVWNSSGASGGAVVIVGPVPIILGSGPASVPLLILALIVTILAFAIMLVGRKLR